MAEREKGSNSRVRDDMQQKGKMCYIKIVGRGFKEN
jgi:hypothetical protein